MLSAEDPVIRCPGPAPAEPDLAGSDDLPRINPRLLGDATFLALDLLENVNCRPGFGQ